MKFQETPLKGAWIITPEPIEDERGFFARMFCANEFENRGLKKNLAQCSISYNRKKGTLRGMHFQASPHAEAKLVTCIKGAIYDVIVDMRVESPTYMQWAAFELDENKQQGLYIPEGCAHGFQTLLDECKIMYMISEFYYPESTRGFRWDDPVIGIQWPETADRIISEKDCSWLGFPK